MTLLERTEAALCGFLLWDLWAIVANDREMHLRRPKNSMQMAWQTRQNLQGIALTQVLMAAKKEKQWTPWAQAGHALSEIHIERQFGQYRGTSPSSELTCKSYWLANAKVAQRTAARNNSQQKHATPDVQEEDALTTEQLLVL